MATLSLSNITTISRPKRLYTTTNYMKPTKTQTFLHKPLHYKPITTGSVLLTTTNNKRLPSLKAHVTSEESPPYTTASTNEKDGTDQHEEAVPQLPNLNTLLKVYKEAIIYGDERTVFEIESRINIVEKAKNELVQKVSDLSAEVSTGKEKYIRLQADFDNFRRRSEKERVNTRSDAQGEVIESLLPMVDSFERAKQQIKPETEKEKKIDTSYQGIYKQFVEIMRSLRVAAVPTVGKPFDPLVHEAIAREESNEYKEGIVIQEFRRGFLLGERLLRPAMVKVSSGPGNKKTPSSTTKPAEEATTAAGVDDR